MKDKIKSYIELLFQAVLPGAGVMIGNGHDSSCDKDSLRKRIGQVILLAVL